MTTSEPTRVFVWTWLPGEAEPVVAGALDQEGEVVTFTYGASYLSRDSAVSLYLPELPLQRGAIRPRVGTLAGCINDASPDAWGMRVILNRLRGRGDDDPDQLSALTYLIESGSDRIGALDFQASSEIYMPRGTVTATLAELHDAAQRVMNREPLPPALDEAILHGSSIGGARPKAGLIDGDRHLIAKFSSTADPYPVVQGEFLSMMLARRAGLSVAPVELTQVLDKYVLLIERFDRPAGGGRTPMVSALTILELDEIGGRYATYVNLAAEIRARFTNPDDTLRELFARITFNILTGNNDDHARNHAAFWDGQTELLTLTPAYDITPQLRGGGATKQLMAIGDPDENGDPFRDSQLHGCVKNAYIYHLTEAEAREIIDSQVAVIENEWDDACDEATLTQSERDDFWNRQYLNPFAFYGYQTSS